MFALKCVFAEQQIAYRVADDHMFHYLSRSQKVCHGTVQAMQDADGVLAIAFYKIQPKLINFLHIFLHVSLRRRFFGNIAGLPSDWVTLLTLNEGSHALSTFIGTINCIVL